MTLLQRIAAYFKRAPELNVRNAPGETYGDYAPYTYSADPQIDPDGAMTIPAYAAGVFELAESLASCPLRIYRRQADDEREYIDDHPALSLFRDNPNTAEYNLREAMYINLLVYGNSYAEIDLGMGGAQPITLYPLSNAVVQDIRLDAQGYKQFRVYGEVFTEDRILHIAGRAYAAGYYSGITGLAPAHLFGRNLSLAIETDRHGIRALRAPITILQQSGDDPINDDATYGQSIINRYKAAATDASGLFRAPAGYEVGANPTNSEQHIFNTTVQSNVLEMARINRLPASRIGYEENSTYSNLLHDRVKYVEDSLLPIARRVEAAFKRRFLRDDEYIEHDYAHLLEGTFTDAIDAVAMAYQSGLITLNEARERLKYPATPDGDVFADTPSETDDTMDEDDTGDTDGATDEIQGEGLDDDRG